MTPTEAKRIASVVRVLRPEWSEGLMMAVLSDYQHRVYEDVMVAAVACYVDPTTKRPGRIHEAGPWWLTVTQVAPLPQVRAIADNDCAICFRPQALHSALSKLDDHEYEPQHVRTTSEGPSDEARARINRAAQEAQMERTKAKEAATERPLRDPSQVLAEHVEAGA